MTHGGSFLFLPRVKIDNARRNHDLTTLACCGPGAVQLANHCIQELIADPQFPTWTEDGEQRNPTVRLDFEQAICIASIGEGIAATRNKHWGDGPYIRPLEPEDPIDPMFVLYIFKENSV